MDFQLIKLYTENKIDIQIFLYIFQGGLKVK